MLLIEIYVTILNPGCPTLNQWRKQNPLMDLTDREATLIIAALVGLSYDWEQADSEVADEAWDLAKKVAEEKDLDPEKAVKRLR